MNGPGESDFRPKIGREVKHKFDTLLAKRLWRPLSERLRDEFDLQMQAEVAERLTRLLTQRLWNNLRWSLTEDITKARNWVALGDVDPAEIGSAERRARVLLAQWHRDEAASDAEAFYYADLLIGRLEEHNLFIEGHNW